ncbi:hypothetical protein TREMEDRAFT_65463 [Tremella mesenterica DSM 1558]|uniref:uncharacterized protein n=1 Tax=Tremella mesenterica (strain ATCC 24925 / CBS 8224 / DSM 1558 / NBRC 9311 / NRRL Y-6157 / RJB 2259-6 / UBC 559-6) TaxID=578456 RepID=UPI00032CBAF0|nr:uncharacterized protein TREMEDRAFT_65463 [Tremella mesenterica DSM 1558]EIW66595.1 hypothetical protein TREMEDRAFT_65463 [Tremella mesenterica DSM 1558]
MPKASKLSGKGKNKVYSLPSTQKKRDLGVPKLNATKLVGKSYIPPASQVRPSHVGHGWDEEQSNDPSSSQWHVDSSLIRDSSSKAFMRELRKVLDARDPDGTRSRWVEDEVRKRAGTGKRLLGVVNKIDLVPRANLEAWIKHLRLSFPCMPFKSSTQSQRHNLSQAAIPLAQPTSTTVGVVGYPNVGKSSLINSLKRSRACAVAAMPGKTRVVQEVALDKGVKLLDCPGVVLEEFSKEEGEKKKAEMMLRNCIKAELVEDPIVPVEVILDKVGPEILCKMYDIPPYSDVREFLIRVALTRGRLGKGGIPDLDAAAVSVLRDWNTGKIPYYTMPPLSRPAPTSALAGDTEMAAESDRIGDAKILTELSEAFTIDGLFDNLNDEAVWEHDDVAEEGSGMDEDLILEPESAMQTHDYHKHIDSDSEDERLPRVAPPPLPKAAPSMNLPITNSIDHNNAKLFTPEEISVLPSDVLDRHKLKQQAKKAKKRRLAAMKTEDELMLGFMGMDVEESDPLDSSLVSDLVEALPTSKKRRAKKLNKPTKIKTTPSLIVTEEEKKEKEFANFLASVGVDDSDEEL